MLIISDGNCSGVNPIYPLLILPSKKIIALDGARLRRTAPIFIVIEFILCLAMTINLFSDSKLSQTSAYISVYLSGSLGILMFFRVIFRKTIIFMKEKTYAVSVAPPLILIDHVLLFLSFWLGGLMNAKIAHLDFVGLNIFSLMAWFSLLGSTLPLLNIIAFRWKNGDFINY